MFLNTIFSDELHKNIEVHSFNVLTAEFIRTIPTASQFLLLMPHDAADDIDNLVADAHHDFNTVGRRAHDYCYQGCIRRLRKYRLAG
jgi:hypothetical protein